MSNSPALHKFPEGSTNLDYDVFEEMPDGVTVWRACVFRIEKVESKFRELAKEPPNRILTISLLDQSASLIRPCKLSARPNLPRVS
jgi:hypothetical protein